VLSGEFDADCNGHEDKVQPGANLVKKRHTGGDAPPLADPRLAVMIERVWFSRGRGSRGAPTPEPGITVDFTPL